MSTRPVCEVIALAYTFFHDIMLVFLHSYQLQFRKGLQSSKL